MNGVRQESQDTRAMRRDKQQARCAEISTQRTMRNKAMARMTTRACRTAGSTELPRCYAGKGVKGRDAFNAVCGSSADATRLGQDGDPIRLCPLLDECRTELGFLQAAHAIACVVQRCLRARPRDADATRSTLSAGTPQTRCVWPGMATPFASVGRMPHPAGLPPSCPCDRMRDALRHGDACTVV